MSESKTGNESSSTPIDGVVPAKSGEAPPASAGEQPPASQLTKEEQWALFEKELKESDWGHQPC